MRPVSFGPLAPNASTDQKLDWIIRSLRETRERQRRGRDRSCGQLQRQHNLHPTRQINVTSPTASNIAAVLASFLADLRKRGANKST